MAHALRRLYLAAGLSAGLAMTAFCSVAMLRGTIPFGRASRGVDDLGNQAMPFYSVLWGVLRGQGASDLVWKWTSGGGVPFLPEYGTYLASPIAPLVALFPHSSLDVAVFVTIALRIGCAAALMAVFLLRFRPQGRLWVASAFGFAYACCGWTFNDAEYQQMWLDGLAALPALLLVGLGARGRRRLVLGALIVAVCWWANFYTAFMASLGAAIILLVLCVGEGDGAVSTLKTLGRFFLTGVLGVALTAVLLYPTVTGVLAGRQAPVHSLKTVAWPAVAARLFPLSEGVSVSPSFFVGVSVLLLALALPFHHRLPVSARLAYPIGLVAVVATMQWPASQLVWSGFDDPNGSPFRAAFVMCGLLVVSAWVCVADDLPSLRALGIAALLVLALERYAAGAPVTVGRHPMSTVLAAVLIAVTVVAVLAATADRDTVLGRLRPVPLGTLRAGSAVVLSCLVLAGGFAELVATGVYIENRRERLIHAQPSWTSLAPLHTLSDDFDARGDWPWYRANAHLGGGTNRAALAGVPGLDYYSTLLSEDVAATFARLGAPWAFFGRANFTPDDELGALLGARRVYSFDEQTRVVQVRSQAALPMVRVLPHRSSELAVGSDPFSQRNLLATAPVYAVPPVSLTRSGAARVIRARCAPGATAQLFAPRFNGMWSTATDSGRVRPRDPQGLPYSMTGVFSVGQVPPDGDVVVTLTPAEGQRSSVEGVVVGCLDTGVLREQQIVAAGQLSDLVIEGSRLSASFAKPTTGDVLVATVRQRGWNCAADGRGVDVGDRAGVMSVSVDGARELECRYRPPGLVSGLVISLVAALVLIVVGLRVRGRSSAEARVEQC